jgi:hypothetical protein
MPTGKRTQPPVTDNLRAIKDAFMAEPNLSVSALANRFAAQGVEVKATFIATVKAMMRHRGEFPTPSRALDLGLDPRDVASTGFSLDELILAKQLVDQLGGIERARHALHFLGWFEAEGEPR